MLIGAHLDNLDHPSEASYRRLQLMRAEVVGTMWTDGTRHRGQVYGRLEELLTDPVYVVRVGPSGRTTAAAWAADVRAALAEVPLAALAAGRVRVRALNEVNLPAEGGWPPEAYAAFLRAARRAARLPKEAPLLSAPLSLGLPDWPDWWQRFVGASGGRLPADRVAVNCYAHLVDHARSFTQFGRPVDVTEIGTLELPPGRQRAAWLLDRGRMLAAAGVQSAQAFIVGGRSNGAWDERYILTDDEAAAIGQRHTFSVAPGDVGDLMRGRGMFVWYLEAAERGDLAAIGARARAAGVRFVLVKCGDGGAAWRQFSPATVAALKAEGLEVHGWAYCYGEDVDAELAVAESCFEAGADGYVADVEAEYEGRWREAERFAEGLARLRRPGRLIGYTPLPVIDYHQALPYAQLNRVADVVMPQLYVRALGDGWGPDRLWEQWHRWSGLWRDWGVPVPRIVPVGEAFGAATGLDLAHLAAACAANGAPDMAFWEWSQAREEHWSAIAACPAAAPQAAQPLPARI
jgi:hypothetical protein